METILLKKSYQLNNLKEIKFKDLWGSYGIFTTMRILGKPMKILFFKYHIKNLINSLKICKINTDKLEEKLKKIIKINLKHNFKYNHLLRLAVNNKTISISLRKQLKSKKKFFVKIVNYQRINPKLKNLKYKKILSFLNNINTTNTEVILSNKKKILEGCTTNVLFASKKKIYSPVKNLYEGTTLKFFKSKHHGPINIGSEEKVSINEMIEKIEKISNKKFKKNYQLDKPKGVRGRSSKNEKMIKNLKWSYTYKLEQGIKRTYEWIYNELKEMNPNQRNFKRAINKSY